MTLDELALLEPAKPWDAVDTNLERRFEGWIENLAADRQTGIVAAAACVELALPIAAASSTTGGQDFGGPYQGLGHVLTPAQQLDAVSAYIESGTALPRHTVEYSRQVRVGDPDLRPFPDDPAHWCWYFVEATNLLVMACLHGDGGGPHGEPTGRSCAARAAMCAYKSMHTAGVDRETDLRRLIAAVQSTIE